MDAAASNVSSGENLPATVSQCLFEVSHDDFNRDDVQNTRNSPQNCGVGHLGFTGHQNVHTGEGLQKLRKIRWYSLSTTNN